MKIHKTELIIFLAVISFSFFGAAGATSAAEVCEMLSRSSAVLHEPMRPFKSDSIWNRMIPAGSTYTYVQDAIFGDPNSTPVYVYPDLVSICYSDPGEPMTNITRNVGWNYPERSQDTGNVQYSRKLSAKDCGCVNWHKTGNNFFVLIDSITKLADLGVGAWRLEGGSLMNFPSDGMGAHNLDVVDGYGIRTYGRASQLPAMGGMIRPGELQTGINHAVAVSMMANRYSSARHYVWPAFGADSFASDGYKGTNENYTIGTLLAIPPTIKLDTMTWKTVQGLNLAKAAQKYGWYIVDTSGVQHSWSIAFEDEAARFDLGGSIDPITGFFKANSSKINETDLSSDLNQILKNLSAVTSNVPTDTVAPVTTASPAPGVFSSAQTVSLTANEPATTLYSTDGGATTRAYKQPINISQTMTLMFYSMDSMGNKENFKTNIYTINSSDTAPRNICLADAKLCPDGTFVGRTGKNCEFATCGSVGRGSETTPTTSAERAKREKDIRGEIQKKRLEVAKRQAQLISKRLDAATERVQKLSDRVKTVLDNLTAKGVDVTASQSHLATAKTNLDEAYTKTSAVKLAIETAFANSMSKEALKSVQDLVKDASKIIREAHKHVALAVSTVKPGFNKPRSATTTPIGKPKVQVKDLRIFKTSFESVDDFKGFYIVPQNYKNTASHDRSTEQVRSGSYSHKGWVYKKGEPSTLFTNNNHRGYPTIQLYKTDGGAFKTPVLIEFWVWLDMELAKGEWFSFATLDHTTSDTWDAVLINLSDEKIVHTMHVPFNGQGKRIFQTTDIKFPMRKWVKLTACLDFDADHGNIKVWQDDRLVSEAEIGKERAAGLFTQVHFGLYAPPSVSKAVVYNDDLIIKEGSCAR